MVVVAAKGPPQAQKCAWYNKQQFVFSDDSDCEDEILAQHEEASNHNLSEEQAVQPVDEDIILYHTQSLMIYSHQQKSKKSMILHYCIFIIQLLEKYFE